MVVIGYFGYVQTYAAVAFIVEARRAAGVTRWRLRLAAIGTSAVIGIIVLGGIARLTDQQPTPAMQGLLAFTVLAGYYFGLATPRWLRRSWQRGQLFRFLKLAATRDPADREQHAAGDLSETAGRAVIARTTGVLLKQGEQQLRVAASSDSLWVGQTIDLGTGLLARTLTGSEAVLGSASDCEPELTRIVGRDSVLVVPIVREARCWGALVVVQRQGSLFPGEDPDLLAQFCRHTADTLDHAQLVNEQRRRLEEENLRVLEASRLKGEFLANMSHELRTPLNAIIGFSDLLYDGRVTPAMPEYKEFLGNVRSSGRHLLQLINDVLDLSKVEAGRFTFLPEPLDPHATVKEVLGVLHATIQNKGIRVSHEVDRTLTDIVIDPARFRQVLYNYLSNALKFTDRAGEIVVRVQADGPQRFRLEVQDSGIGIASDDVNKLFVEFQQLEAGAAKTHSGTGLGLALTKRLVEAQGGAVGVISAPGQGSTFSAVLPRRTEALETRMDSRQTATAVSPVQEVEVATT
jgi:signal transduction histidine kinase